MNQLCLPSNVTLLSGISWIEKTTANHYTLSTSSMRIDYLDNGFPFGQTNLSVHFRNQDQEKTWKIYMDTEEGNLGGAIETLDNVSRSCKTSAGFIEP